MEPIFGKNIFGAGVFSLEHWAGLHNAGNLLHNFVGHVEFFVVATAFVVVASLVESAGTQVDKPVDVVRFVFAANVVAVAAVVELKNFFLRKNLQAKIFYTTKFFLTPTTQTFLLPKFTQTNSFFAKFAWGSRFFVEILPRI